MKLGNAILRDRPVLLAPMEDITDPSFRSLCKEFGTDFMFTEFISSDGLIRDGAKSVKKLEIYENERPIGIQLYGHLTEAMVEAALMAEASAPDLIDINFGCPVRKIANRGAGAGMLRNIPLMIEMTTAIVKSVKTPVSVKTRLGWDEENKNIVEVAERLQDTGICALTIHGRTRAQFYKGVADWHLIGEVKNNPRMTIPIIGNGDIDSPEKAAEMFNNYGVDAIMIGRAAVGRPWLFRDVRHYLDTGNLLPEPTIREKVSWALEHLNLSLKHKEGNRAIFEMRRHLASYFKGLPHFRDMRLQLLTSVDPEIIRSLLLQISDEWGNCRVDMQAENKNQIPDITIPNLKSQI
ncbi:MAG: tRNA dihydrouridine synthase DusB [Bacteroidetes bacterium]|nr:tRNA dihydrouridine synthase DusB [Bacteroidota bacterium]